jgi:hypothetical protein
MYMLVSIATQPKSAPEHSAWLLCDSYRKSQTVKGLAGADLLIAILYSSKQLPIRSGKRKAAPCGEWGSGAWNADHATHPLA